MDPQTRLSVNRPALLSCACAAAAVLFVPGPDHVMIDWFPTGFLAFTAVTAMIAAVKGYQNRQKLFAMMRRAGQSSGVLGDARFATLLELRRAGMLDPKSGPLLCTFDGIPIFLPKGRHYFLEGPSGAGKSSCIAVALIYHLAHLGYSVCITDLKPELCYIVGPELARRGFRVRYNNPARIGGGLPHHDANPYAPLCQAVHNPELNGQAFPLAETFALEITPESDKGSTDNTYFRNIERQLHVVMILALAAIDPEGAIPSVLHRHLADPKATLGLLCEASECDALNGDLAAEARGLLSLHDRHPEHFEGARTGLANALSAFRTSSDLGMLGATGDFDPADLRDDTQPPIILFDLVPAESPEVYVKALALQTIARMHVLKTIRGRNVAFCLDEASNLPVKSITKEITLMRSRGALIALLMQSRSEGQRVFGEKAMETIIGNCVEQYLQVGDPKLAEAISRRVGDHTVVTKSKSFAMKDGGATSSFGEQARPLLPVDEVMALPEDATLVFVPGLRPILGKKVAYYQTSPFKHWAGANPQEQHPKSRLTKVSLTYGKDARDTKAPEVKDASRRHKAILRRKQRMARRLQGFRVDWPAFCWVPIVGAVAALITYVGTPHILYEYTIPASGDVRRCTYLGADGLVVQTRAGRCGYLIMHRGWEAWLNR
ncbi:MAG: type IV secretory system conjugative DNA transfer family protein [Pseudomonadota bacterium]